MKFIRLACEEEMVAAFLAAEIASPRHGKKLRQLVRRGILSKRLCTKPNLSSPRENKVRAQALDTSRGYLRRKLLFEGYPRGVEWRLIEVSAGELLKFRYLNHEGPRAFTHGTRIVGDLDLAWCRQHQPFFVEAISGIRARLKAGEELMPLIAVSTSIRSKKIVVLEGNTRVSAMSLGPKNKMYQVLLGLSPRVRSMYFW